MLNLPLTNVRRGMHHLDCVRLRRGCSTKETITKFQQGVIHGPEANFGVPLNGAAEDDWSAWTSVHSGPNFIKQIMKYLSSLKSLTMTAAEQQDWMWTEAWNKRTSCSITPSVLYSLVHIHFIGWFLPLCLVVLLSPVISTPSMLVYWHGVVQSFTGL